MVVMLADIQAEDAEVCAQYWPRQINSSQYFKEITITTESEKTEKGYTERVLSILDAKVYELHYTVCIVINFDHGAIIMTRITIVSTSKSRVPV